jgi:hypothetical protein
MKYFKILFLLSLIVVVNACKDVEPGIEALNLKVKVQYDPSLTGYTFPLQNIEVKLKNITTQQTVSALSSGAGESTFAGVIPGNYDIDAVITIKADDYTSATGVKTTSDVVLNASLKNQSITSSTIATIPALILKVGKIGDWLIKQVYYSGSDRTNGALYRDQFIEIINNSNETLFADNLYIAEAVGNSTATPDFTRGFYLPNGQWDWSKSVNMPANVKANEDFLYTKSLYKIGGDGSTYPVKAGESIVIAQSAQNHKSPFTGTDGVGITVKDPSLTIDLSNADFEVVLAPLLTRPLDSDIDNPKVPNLEVLNYFGTDYIMDNPGRNGFFIFKTTESVKDYNRYATPNTTTITSSTRVHIQVPIKHVIDAVETQPSPAEQVPKKFGASLDAGFAFVPKGAYTSQSIIRKTAKTIGTRRILQDTNNSSNDFDFFDKANPKGFK